MPSRRTRALVAGARPGQRDRQRDHADRDQRVGQPGQPGAPGVAAERQRAERREHDAAGRPPRQLVGGDREEGREHQPRVRRLDVKLTIDPADRGLHVRLPFYAGC